MTAPIHLVRGDDASLVRDRVVELVEQLVGDADRGLAVEELAGDDYEMGALVDAAQTPPFLTEYRVVVARDAHRFSTAETVAPLVAYLGDPLPSTRLVLVWESGRVPKSLIDAVKKSGGEQIDASPRKGWVDADLADAPIRLDGAARKLIVSTIGEDVARLRGLLEVLAATYGAGARVGADEVTPYLGAAGGVAPWDLTDAIDAGDIATALDTLRRMMGAGERHALVVMSTLHNHFARMLALDGAEVTGEKDAAALLGLRGSTFPARKALNQARKLGSGQIGRAIQLLAVADLDLKGARDLPNDVVMEVLVARLAQLARR